MATRTIATYATPGTVEISDLEFNKSLEMLKPTGMIELLHGFARTLAENEKNFQTRLNDMAARHAGILRPKEQAVNQFRQDLAAAQRETKADIDRGIYTQVHAHQAKEAEVTQALYQAEYELAAAKQTCDEEMARHLTAAANGDYGTGGAVQGVEWFNFRNVLLATVLEWSNSFTHDMASANRERARQAVDNFRYSQDLVKQAAQRLQDHKSSQAAKFGGNVKPDAQAQPDRKKEQAQTNAALAELQKYTGHNYTGQATYNNQQPEPSRPAAAQAGPVAPQYMRSDGGNR